MAIALITPTLPGTLGIEESNMKRNTKIYKVRTTQHPWHRGERIFIIARGYRDALRIQKQYGGKIV